MFKKIRGRGHYSYLEYSGKKICNLPKEEMFDVGVEWWVETNYTKRRAFSDREAWYQILEADGCSIWGEVNWNESFYAVNIRVGNYIENILKYGCWF